MTGAAAGPGSGQDPGVLRAAVLGGVDDERAGVAGHAGQAARQDAGVRALAEEHERAQVDVAGGESMGEGTVRPSGNVGCVESMTRRWAIQAPGAVFTASRGRAMSPGCACG